MSISRGLVVDIAMNTAKIMQDITKVTKHFSKFGKVFSKLGDIAKRVGRAIFSFKGVLIGLLGAGGIGLLIKQSIEATNTLGKTADKLGVTTKALQEFRYAGELANIQTSTADMALQRFSRRLGEAAIGTGELKGTLDSYGIAVTDSSGRTRSTIEVLGDLAEVTKNAHSSQEQLRIGFKAFDSEGAALVTVLKQGREAFLEMANEAQSLGIVLDITTVKNVEAAHDSMLKLGKLFLGMRDQIVGALAPAF